MANIFSVTNSEELMKALASATGGDTIELAGGDYGALTLADGWTDFNVKFGAPVTIRSADTDQPASFSSLELKGVSNLTFEGLVFDYEFSPTDKIWIRPFQILGNSNNITIQNSVFDGDLASGLSDIDNGYGYGIGLSVRDSSNVTLENNEFFNWHRGAVFAETDNISLVQNEIHSIRSDGLNFAGVSSVLIEGNYIHDFQASPVSSDHRDMIQIWTNATTSATTDVTIRDNIFDIGTGSYTQTIFMRNGAVDTGLAGSEMYYRSILIENNTIYNAHTHGITVGETDGLIIRNNSIFQVEGEMHGISGGVTIPKINVKPNSFSVEIEGNVVSGINGFNNQSDWILSGNAIIQPSDYLEHFITSTLDSDGRVHNFIVLPDSVIENLGAGSDHIQFPYAAEALKPQFQVYSDLSSGQSLVFDASLTAWSQGVVSETEADFTWYFGDGSTATGQIVKHNFAAPGYHDVTLIATTKDGITAIENFSAGVSGENILQFDAQSGLFEALAFGEDTPLNNGALPLVTSTEGYALKLGGDGTQASVAASELSRFFNTDAFELSMTMKANSPTSWGEIARIHTSFTVGVDQNGNLTLQLFLEDGSQLKMASNGVSLNDGDRHDVSIRFDGEAGNAAIVIDGKTVASESVSGFLGGGPRSLDFGNPWGQQNFDGELSTFSLSADSRDFPIYNGEKEPISENTANDLQPIELEDSTSVAPDALDTVETTDPVETNDTSITDPVEIDDGSATEENAIPEEDSGVLTPLLQGGYTLDFAAVTTSDTIILHDDAHVIHSQNGPALSFDGKRDFVELGRLTEFEESQKIAFSVDFTSENATNRAERLVWNHEKIGVALEGDGVRVHVGNKDSKFDEGFLVTGLGLNDGNQHSATVMVDAETDRLQIIVDDILVLDKDDVDFDFVGAGGHEWGWSLGTSWNRWFEGEVHEFQVSDDFAFVGSATEDGTILA